MNFKIIILSKTQTEICLHRDRSDAGEEIVRITAFVTSATGTEPMLEDVVKFNDEKAAGRFVADYSEESAEEFLKWSLVEEGIR